MVRCWAFFLFSLLVLSVVGLPTTTTTTQQDNFESFSRDPNPPFSEGYPYPYPEQKPTNIFQFDTSCPDFCSGHGECVKGKCVCEDGYLGDSCDRAFCPNNCGGKGYCKEGICDCRSGWVGDDCLTPGCDKNCSNNGRCLEGTCLCDTLWEGDICDKPKYGVPGLSKPPKFGRIENIRINSTCFVVRIPPSTGYRSALLERAEFSMTHDGECILDKGEEPHQTLWQQGKIKPTIEKTLQAGDHLICPVCFGCENVRVDAFYEGSNQPEVYLNGDMQYSPSPSPLPANAVDPKFCFNFCSQRGVCLNKTAHYNQEYYECSCELPWKLPCCCSKDREDNRPQVFDPLNETFPETEFNKPPCSRLDDCGQCTQILESTATSEWTKLSLKDSCVWHVNRAQCVKLDQNSGLPIDNIPCRNHGIVFSEERNGQ